MNKLPTNEPITLILFKESSIDYFSHTNEFKRLLNTEMIKVFPKKDKIYQTVELLENSLRARATITPVSPRQHRSSLDCTHLIALNSKVRRNEFFDLAFNENILGSFTTTLDDLVNLDKLCDIYFEALRIHTSPLDWIRDAKINAKAAKKLRLNDPTVSEINLHYLIKISETYGLQGLNDSKSKITKWVEDHRWMYID
jgi:hypothetical protein